MIVRTVQPTDRAQWEPLWHAYLDFYRAELSDEVTEATWAALCDPDSSVRGLVAESETELVGLAHIVLHPTTWATRPTCYLEDLYVLPTSRGGRVGRRLIEAVYAHADEVGASAVYWITQEYNAPARSLYETVAHRSSFVLYQRS